jgi:N-acetylglutamate synthase-like GNAT family acetyltransferase
MTARLLPGTEVRVRRGRRSDVPALKAVLGDAAGDRLERRYRRMLADLGNDIYVAEDAAGAIVGVVALNYARSLCGGGPSAMLDGARACREPARPLLEGLIAFAEDRARRHGCRSLVACLEHADGELRAALLARGYRTGESFVRELGGAS